MKKYLVNNNSDTLLIFFTGWGCDEYEFEHLNSNSDVLILYDYFDLDLDFDFSKYKNFNLIAFSAGVFIASIFDFALFGEYDTIFNLSAQKEFYKERLYLMKNARHSLFFKVENYEQFLIHNFTLTTIRE